MVVVGISFSSRSVGFAIVENEKLEDWYLQCFFERWSQKKLKRMLFAVERAITQNRADVVAIKIPDVLPISKGFMQIVGGMNSLIEQLKIPVSYFTTAELKEFLGLDSRTTKPEMIARILDRNPNLSLEFNRETKYTAPHYDKIFEAYVAAMKRIH